MPRCKVCGNNRSFGSSMVSPVSPSANGLITGMIGDFNGGDNIVSINSLGADKKTINAATGQPQSYFDTCLACGSQEVEWPGTSS